MRAVHIYFMCVVYLSACVGAAHMCVCLRARGVFLCAYICLCGYLCVCVRACTRRIYISGVLYLFMCERAVNIYICVCACVRYIYI